LFSKNAEHRLGLLLQKIAHHATRLRF